MGNLFTRATYARIAGVDFPISGPYPYVGYTFTQDERNACLTKWVRLNRRVEHVPVKREGSQAITNMFTFENDACGDCAIEALLLFLCALLGGGEPTIQELRNEIADYMHEHIDERVFEPGSEFGAWTNEVFDRSFGNVAYLGHEKLGGGDHWITYEEAIDKFREPRYVTNWAHFQAFANLYNVEIRVWGIWNAGDQFLTKIPGSIIPRPKRSDFPMYEGYAPICDLWYISDGVNSHARLMAPMVAY